MQKQKKGEFSMHEDLRTDDEWTESVSRKGVLTVVDVYNEWSGPCLAMSGFLKKIKLEVGDEVLQYAVARADSIDALKMFRGHCKPIWLFLIDGKVVSVMHGANAPLLGKIISDTIANLSKNVDMDPIDLQDAVPESLLHLDLALELEEKRSREMAKKMTNPDYFPCDRYALVYIQDFVCESSEYMTAIHSSLEKQGLNIVESLSVKLDEGEPDHLLDGTGRENMAPKYINQPARLMLLEGEEAHATLKSGFHEDNVIDLIEKSGEKGLLLGGETLRYLKLIQKYFFTIADTSIKQNILRMAHKRLAVFSSEVEEISEKVHSMGIEVVEEVHNTTLDPELVMSLTETDEALKEPLSQELSIFALRNVKKKISEAPFLELEALYTTADESIIFTVFPNFGAKQETNDDDMKRED